MTATILLSAFILTKARMTAKGCIVACVLIVSYSYYPTIFMFRNL